MENVKISIPFGKGCITTEIPSANFKGVATPPGRINCVDDEVEEVKRALSNPVGSPSLKELVKPGYKVAIIISDYTRPTPTRLISGPILEELHGAGVTKEDITFVVACGLHVPSPLESLKVMLGQDILDNYKVVNNNADDKDSMVFVGKTSMGIPIEVNKVVANADLSLTIGGISPHQYAGWSGGAKNVLPGVSSRDTVNAHHVLLSRTETCLGKSDGNPFREQLEEAARLAKVNFLVNVILSPEKKISCAVAGDIVKAHRAGIAFSEEKIIFDLPEKVDVVIAAPGGAPRDGDLWQADGKCLTRIPHVLKDGGTVILVSQCSNGLGLEAFGKALNSTDPEGIMEAFKNSPFTVPLAKAFNVAKISKQFKFYFVTEGVTAEMLPKFPIKFFASLDEAVKKVLEDNPAASIIAVPDASEVVIKITQ